MEAIAQQFTDFYYQTFDADRSALQSLYRPNSMLSFEGQQMQGAEAIVEKLKSLPFQKVQHKVETRDAQPTGDGNSLTVMVTGALVVDDSPQPMRFSQTFVLIPDAGSYFVFNDIFREDPFNIQTSDWSTTIFSHSIENPLRKFGEDTDGCRKLPCIGTFAYVFCARNGCSGGCLEGYCAAAEGSSF